MDMKDFPAPNEGFVVTHFLVSKNVAKATAFYTEVLSGKAVMEGEPTIVKLANSWVTINVGGGPTDDKPGVTLKTRTDPNTVEMFLNIRVADIQACYAEWRSKGGRVHHRAEGTRARVALLHAGPGRVHHRGWPAQDVDRS